MLKLKQAIAKEGLRYVANGCNSVALQRGLIKASHFFAGKVRELATPVTTREQFNSIASMSCNDVPMGELLGEAFERVGVDGSTTVEDGQGILEEAHAQVSTTSNQLTLGLGLGLTPISTPSSTWP